MKNKAKSGTKKSYIFFAVIIISLILIIVPCRVASTVSDGLSFSAHSASKPLLVAHRGFSSIKPENTGPAFYAAAEAGFDGYEFDLHTTKDGEWVVIHDDTVDRMTDGTGNVEDFTLEEIRSLYVDGGKGNEDFEYLAEKPGVPTLGEALSYAEEYDIFPVIEIKKCDIKYLADLKAFLDEKGLSQKAVIISFTKEYMEAYRALDKNIEMFYLSHNPSKEDIDWCRENNFGINFNHKNYYKCASAIAYAREQGIKIAVWTVDNVIYKDIMVLFGAEIITTNKITPAEK
ncbi:MAG: hypothetical protein IJN88_05260 [Clostridia bacterium]|nr:hypothetical protein [Clostridia bacterium]